VSNLPSCADECAAANSLAASDRTEGGTVLLDGKPVRFLSSANAVAAGVFLVPEDRKGRGLLLELAIAENITLPNLNAYVRGILISRDAENQMRRAKPQGS
jgi:ribose transport system ATP-binding protein